MAALGTPPRISTSEAEAGDSNSPHCIIREQIFSSSILYGSESGGGGEGHSDSTLLRSGDPRHTGVVKKQTCDNGTRR